MNAAISLKPKKASSRLWLVFVIALGLLISCSSDPTPSGQTPEDRAFEAVLFGGTQKTQGFLEGLNGLVTASGVDFTLAAEAMTNATDSFAAWIADFERTAADLTASLRSQQNDLGEFADVIPDEVKQAATSSFGAVTVRDCIARAFRGLTVRLSKPS